MEIEILKYGFLEKVMLGGFYAVHVHYETDYHGLLLSWGI